MTNLVRNLKNLEIAASKNLTAREIFVRAGVQTRSVDYSGNANVSDSNNNER
jgi:hypothetical protein